MGNNYVTYFLVSGLSFVLWVMSLVLFDIFGVIDDLTGRKAKRQLKIIQASQTKEVQDTSEELRVLQQESLLDEELGRVARQEVIPAISTQEPLPVRKENIEELSEEGATDFIEEIDGKTGYMEISEENLSTGILDNQMKDSNIEVSDVVVVKRLSNIENGGND